MLAAGAQGGRDRADERNSPLRECERAALRQEERVPDEQEERPWQLVHEETREALREQHVVDGTGEGVRHDAGVGVGRVDRDARAHDAYLGAQPHEIARVL